MKDYFNILKVDEDTSKQTMEKIYKEMLRKYPAEQYPEKNKDIQEAYMMLSDESTKAACIDFNRMEPSSKVVYADAQQSIMNGRCGEAVKALEKAIKMEQHKTHLYYLLGVAYMSCEKPRKAVTAFEQVIESYPNDLYLNLSYSKACFDAKQYKKAVECAKRAYSLDSNNFLSVFCLVEGYLNTHKYHEAIYILTEAFNNMELQERHYNICSKLSYVNFLLGKYDESIRLMKMLLKISANNDEVVESGMLFFESLEFYLEHQMFAEANSCAEVILELMPDRGDILDIKNGLETILLLEPEYTRFEEDDFIPDGLKGLIANEIFPEESVKMTQEQKQAYKVLNEYQILNDYSQYPIALRYMKNNYPNLYELRSDFLDAIQDTKERKKLTNKNKAMFYQYHNIIEDMVEQWGDEFDEDEDYEDEDYEDDDYEDEDYEDEDYEDEDYEDEDYEDEDYEDEDYEDDDCKDEESDIDMDDEKND